MNTFRNPNPLPIMAKTDNARVKGRFRMRELFARSGKVVGEVVDLSASGMRVYCKGRCEVQAGQQLGFVLVLNDVEVPVRAQAVWVRSLSRKEFLIGLKFESLNESQTAAITKLAVLGRDSLVMAQNDNRFSSRAQDL